MQTKNAAPKKEGQKRGISAARKIQALTEPALLQAAAHTAGLMAPSVDMVTGELTPEATPAEASEVVPDKVVTELSAVVAPDANPVADNNEAAASTESALTEGVDDDANSVPVAEVISESIESFPRTGLVVSPLAQRMRAEAAQRSGRKIRTSHRGLGAEFEAADIRVRTLAAQLEEMAAHLRGSENFGNLTARIAAVRSQIRAQRGSKVEGVEPFNDAIAVARQALHNAKAAKFAFLAKNGVGASTEAGQPSLRQQLRALRAEKQAALDAAGGDAIVTLRAQLKAAKIERKTACETAHAARQGEVQTATTEPDSQPRTDAPDDAQGGS